MRVRYLVATITAVSSASLGAAQNCDCTVYPFRPDPPCAASCSARLLETTDYRSLVRVLGLKPETAKQLKDFSSDRKPANIYEFSQALPKHEFDALNVRLRSLSQDEFRELQKAGKGIQDGPDKPKL